MAELSISDAARLCGVNRRTLQRAVQSGRLTLTANHRVDTAALRRAGYAVPLSQLDTAPVSHQGTAPPPQGAAGDAASRSQEVRHAAVTPQEMPQELALATTLLAHLEEITHTIAALHQEVVLLREDLRRPPQRRRSLTPHVPHRTAVAPQGDTIDMSQVAPHVSPHDAAPISHHVALMPQETPQEGPHHVAHTPQEHATVDRPLGPLPSYIQRIAAVAAEYDTLTLGQLAQLLYDRSLYRARDRKSGVEKPVNRGTLQRWLEQARAAGLL